MPIEVLDRVPANYCGDEALVYCATCEHVHSRDDEADAWAHASDECPVCCGALRPMTASEYAHLQLEDLLTDLRSESAD